MELSKDLAAKALKCKSVKEFVELLKKEAVDFKMEDAEKLFEQIKSKVDDDTIKKIVDKAPIPEGLKGLAKNFKL